MDDNDEPSKISMDDGQAITHGKNTWTDRPCEIAHAILDDNFYSIGEVVVSALQGREKESVYERLTELFPEISSAGMPLIIRLQAVQMN
jgi:hypothetical protein